MKIINRIVIVFLTLFGAVDAFAQPPCPVCPQNPPPLPIDGGSLFVLLLAAILLGIYVIYRHKLKTKASV